MAEDAAEPKQPPTGPIADLVTDLVRQVADRGRAAIGRRLRRTRDRLELRQLQRDRDHFWVRLGKTAFHLSEAGEIAHPALDRAIARIRELEAQIDEVEAEADAPLRME